MNITFLVIFGSIFNRPQFLKGQILFLMGSNFYLGCSRFFFRVVKIFFFFPRWSTSHISLTNRAASLFVLIFLLKQNILILMEILIRVIIIITIIVYITNLKLRSLYHIILKIDRKSVV